MSESNDKTREISLGIEFGDVVVKANGAQVKISADGSLHGLPAPPANDAAKAKTAPEIGSVAPAGDAHAGWIYAGIFPGDGKPIWVSRFARICMNHWDAAAWAATQGGKLPTRAQGYYLHAVKNKGAFRNLFNNQARMGFQGYHSVAGHGWLADLDGGNLAFSQRFLDGGQDTLYRNRELPVLCVRR